MRILVTNDDGIHAPGLVAAEKIARTISDDVWVVAPEGEQSGASHSLTLTMPLRLREITPRKFAVTGTPTDCVMMAINQVMRDERPALVLSGVNRGTNIADDVTYSGTVAGAMEGTALGIRSIALSQAYGWVEGRDVHWACAETHGPKLIQWLVQTGWPEDVLININFPDKPPGEITGGEITSQGHRNQDTAVLDRRIDGRGNPYFWIGYRRVRSDPPDGTDLRAIYDGRISITPLHLNLTEYRVMERMRRQFDETFDTTPHVPFKPDMP